MPALLAAALSQALIPTAALPVPSGDPCALFNAQSTSSGRPGGAFTLDDQVSMADIGRAAPTGAPGALGASPDGQRIAFLVKRANPRVNAYCQRLVVVPIQGTSNEFEIDRGGEFIRDDFALRDFPAIMGGWDKPNAPRWSPDGQKIAFLKRIAGSTQIWLADSSGKRPAQQASKLSDNVDRFAWKADGAGLIAETRPSIRLQAEEIAKEGRSGFLFNARFAPQFADRPIPTRAAPADFTYISLADGNSRAATVDEVALLIPPLSPRLPRTARNFVDSPRGFAAWLEPKSYAPYGRATQLVISAPDGMRKVCEPPRCEGVRELWWSEDGEVLIALQSSGWARSQTTVLRWSVAAESPTPILTTDDALIGCLVARSELICAREGAARPRRVVAIDLRGGAERVIHDPNPWLSSKAFGSVRRLRFRNPFGTESFADLVLPPDHRAGQKHPLVVVQYTSDGFLRGGTGDEVPIHPLANRGFAVLSFARPFFVQPTPGAARDEELVRANRANWIDRRRVHSSLEIAVKLAIGTGAVDAERMGISGFSDGASTVQWALINSGLFKVASLGSCCEDMIAYPLAAGPRFTDFLRATGHPVLEPAAQEFWKPMSLVLNADRVDTPILIQTGDSEYEAGLDVIETYSHLRKAIELYVFEDEPHVKWQPAHREAMYQRSVDWFEFWLMHRKDCSVGKAAQYARWQAMTGAPAADTMHCRAPMPSPP